uniref:Uncharacterized protein n=1 Tax=Knipowitschia caucasica TaxID=637954 RepID=A0AAV2KKY6_KNICA
MLKPVVKPAEVAHLAPHSPSEPEVTPLDDSSSLGQISVRLLSPLYYLVMRRPLWLTRTTQHCVAPPAMLQPSGCHLSAVVLTVYRRDDDTKVGGRCSSVDLSLRALTLLPLLREAAVSLGPWSCAGGEPHTVVGGPVGTYVGLCGVSAALGNAFCSFCGLTPASLHFSGTELQPPAAVWRLPIITNLSSPYDHQLPVTDINTYATLKAVADKVNLYNFRQHSLEMSLRGSLPMESLEELEPSNPYSPPRHPSLRQSRHKPRPPRSHSSQSLYYSSSSPALLRSWDSRDTLGLRQAYTPQKLCVIEKELHTTRYMPPQPYFVTNSKTEVTVPAAASMKAIVLLVLLAQGVLFVQSTPDSSAETERGTEEPIPCSKSCTCLYDDYSLELNVYCSLKNLTQSDEEDGVELFQRPPGLSLQLPDGDTFSAGSSDATVEDVIETDNSEEKNKSPVTAESSTKYSNNNAIMLSFAKLEHALNAFQNGKQDAIKPIHSTVEIGDGYTGGNREDYCHMLLEKSAYFLEKKTIHYVKKKNMGLMQEENIENDYKKPPTLYIDLRSPSETSTKSIRSPSQFTVKEKAMPSNSPSCVNEGTQTNYGKETAKSMLLRKIRENHYMNEFINKQELYDKSAVECGKQLEFEDAYKSNLEKTLDENITFKTENQNKNHERHKKKRKDHQQKHIVKELEKNRPLKSVGQDASHLDQLQSLPTDLGNEGHMLLIVKLSSPGTVLETRQRKSQKIDWTLTKPHLYNTLVAWFLSLVDPQSSRAMEANVNVPFRVLGLQQLWTQNNGLALYVLTEAKQVYKARNTDIPTPFYNHIKRFLSETSLSSIAPWLPHLNAVVSEDTCNPPISLPLWHLSTFITATSNQKVMDRIFNLKPGFYWQTLETPEHECKGRNTKQELHTQISMTLGFQDFYHIPLVTHYTLQAILDSGLDICGLRLIYPSTDLLPDHFECKTFLQKGAATQSVLAMAVRGPHAHSLSQGLNKQVQLIRQKTPIVVTEDGDEGSLLLYTPHQSDQVHKELCLWFSGRLVEESRKYQEEFLKRGILMTEMDSARASLLGLSRLPVKLYRTLTSQKCLVLILKKENALHHSISRPAALIKEFKTQNLLSLLQSMGDDVQTSFRPTLCFHTVPYSNSMYNIFAQLAWNVPDASTVVLSNQKCPRGLEWDELVVLTLCGQDMSQGLGLLHRALTQHGFDVLGLKWLHTLSRLQAQEVSPYEVGEKSSVSALVTLTSSPALVCALRQKHAVFALKNVLHRQPTGDLAILMSPTPQVANRLCALFFFEHELISCAAEK